MDKKGKYIYKPLQFSDYINNYVNASKTGEIMLDVENDDIYVTEEGINLPISKTKELRTKVLNFLNNDIDGINLKSHLVNRKLTYVKKLKDKIIENQNSAFDILNNSSFQTYDDTSKRVYLEKVNNYNIQQLGNIKLELDNTYDESIKYNERLDELVKVFNKFSTYNGDLNYVSTKNAELVTIWTEINTLFDELQLKLNSMSELTGSIVLLRQSTKQVTKWDVGFQSPAAWVGNGTSWEYQHRWDSATGGWSASKIISICTDGGTDTNLRTGLLTDYNKINNPKIVWADWARPVYKNTKYNDREKLNFSSDSWHRYWIVGNRYWPAGGPPKTSRYGKTFDYEYYRKNAAICDGDGNYIPMATEVSRNPHAWVPCNDSTISVSRTGYENGGTVNQDGWGHPWTDGNYTHYRMGRCWYCGSGTTTVFKNEIFQLPIK